MDVVTKPQKSRCQSSDQIDLELNSRSRPLTGEQDGSDGNQIQHHCHSTKAIQLSYTHQEEMSQLTQCTILCVSISLHGVYPYHTL